MTRKVALYQHIFSYSSVKTVVHWFQVLGCYWLYRLLRTKVTNHCPTRDETALIVAPILIVVLCRLCMPCFQLIRLRRLAMYQDSSSSNRVCTTLAITPTRPFPIIPVICVSMCFCLLCM